MQPTSTVTFSASKKEVCRRFKVSMKLNSMATFPFTFNVEKTSSNLRLEFDSPQHDKGLTEKFNSAKCAKFFY
jgi:hypothetical protein